jgi:hypothetical protein
MQVKYVCFPACVAYSPDAIFCDTLFGTLFVAYYPLEHAFLLPHESSYRLRKHL